MFFVYSINTLFSIPNLIFLSASISSVTQPFHKHPFLFNLSNILVGGISVGSASPPPHIFNEKICHACAMTDLCMTFSGVGTQGQDSWVPGHVRV